MPFSGSMLNFRRVVNQTIKLVAKDFQGKEMEDDWVKLKYIIMFLYHEPSKPTFLEVFMVNKLGFRWPKTLSFSMGFGGLMVNIDSANKKIEMMVIKGTNIVKQIIKRILGGSSQLVNG